MINLVNSIRRWRRTTDTVNELSKLNDRMLNDIGITRTDIPRIARKVS